MTKLGPSPRMCVCVGRYMYQQSSGYMPASHVCLLCRCVWADRRSKCLPPTPRGPWAAHLGPYGASFRLRWGPERALLRSTWINLLPFGGILGIIMGPLWDHDWPIMDPLWAHSGPIHAPVMGPYLGPLMRPYGADLGAHSGPNNGGGKTLDRATQRVVNTCEGVMYRNQRANSHRVNLYIHVVV